MFRDSNNFVANELFVEGNLIFNTESQSSNKGAGIDALRRASLPDAIHDPDACELLRCFSGTHKEYIRNITNWGLGGWKERKARTLWLQGPAGVGKSALAQTCAERLGDKLDAAFFFSRSNQWNEHTKFLPTIIYQLALKYPAYADLLDAKIQRHPSVLERVFEIQFHELLVYPLRKLRSQGLGIREDTVIIIDGLDECDDEDAQRVIIEVITTSVHQQTIPFLWAFFSLPEPHIAAAFRSKQASEVCWQLTLPVSCDADQDIEAYLRDSFNRIRAKHQFPVTFVWPSEEDILQLIDQAEGLFIYVASAARYIASSAGVLGPEAKLRSILALGKPNNGKISDRTPLSNLDRLYRFIMEQIPKDILPTTLLLLFTQFRRHTSVEDLLLINCSILGLSLATFYASINNLHSVLEVQLTNGLPSDLSFYHASFSDFLCDVERSTAEFCVETADIYNRFYSMCVGKIRCLSDTRDVNEPADVVAWPDSITTSEKAYVATRYLFWSSQSPLVRPEADVLRQFPQINWKFTTEWRGDWVIPSNWVEAFIDKMPKNSRRKIIRLRRRRALVAILGSIFEVKRGNFMKLRVKARNQKPYIIGSGSNRVLLMPDGMNDWYTFLAP